MSPQKNFISVIALMIASSAVFAAPIYKWQDEDGKVYFSDQPIDDRKVEKINLQTHISKDNKAFVDHPYSILKQVEYFQALEERQQKLMLEKKLAYQTMKAAEQQQNQVVMPPLDSGIPAIVSVPQYRSQFYPQSWTGNHNHRQSHSTYRTPALSFIHKGDHHRFSFSLGGLNQPNYWNF